MSLRIVTSLKRNDSEIIGIGITEFGKNTYLDLKEVYGNQVRIFNEIKQGKRDKSEKPVYALWTDEEFGYILMHVDKRSDKYELQPRTDKVIQLLNGLPDYKK
ncbi:MAG: hypothetical protein KGI27_06350 [Thaumarchaeota archaeon]|nr:hypothetical protein [Nitrososphaerota archaeon]